MSTSRNSCIKPAYIKLDFAAQRDVAVNQCLVCSRSPCESRGLLKLVASLARCCQLHLRRCFVCIAKLQRAAAAANEWIMHPLRRRARGIIRLSVCTCALTCSCVCVGNFAAGQCKYAVGTSANVMQGDDLLSQILCRVYLSRELWKLANQFPGCDLFEYEMSLIPRVSDK